MTVNDLVERLNSLQGNITVGQLNEIIQDFDEQEPMRDATIEERESVRDYIKDTGVNFYGEKQSCEDAVSRESVDTLVDELARAISDERCHCPKRGRETGEIMSDMLHLPSVYSKELIRLKNSIIPLYRDGEVDEYNRGYNDCWKEVLEKIEYFQVIQSNTPPTTNWEHYADKLYDAAYRRGYEKLKDEMDEMLHVMLESDPRTFSNPVSDYGLYYDAIADVLKKLHQLDSGTDNS